MNISGKLETPQIIPLSLSKILFEVFDFWSVFGMDFLIRKRNV